MFLTVFATYAWTTSPAVGWLDAPEFVAVGASLGVAHSPGHPLSGMLGRLATLVPAGDMVWRVNLVSAACGAAAALGMFVAGLALFRRAAPSLRGAPAAGAAGAVALVFAFSWAAWFQGVRAEVYALQAALLLFALAAVIEFDGDGQPRLLVRAGLLVGLALAHHHLIAVLLFLPAAGAVFARARARWPSARVVAATALCGVLGLAAWLYLPVRGARAVEVNWGAPSTVERFAWTVSARAFHKATELEHVSSRAEDAAQVAGALVEQATPLAVALMLVALYLGLRRPGYRRATALLVAIAGLSAAGRVWVGFEPDTPDHHGYLLPALAAVLLLAGSGAMQLATLFGHADERARLPAAWLAVAGLCALVPMQVSTHARASSLRGAYGSSELAEAELTSLPPRSLLLVSYFQTSFRIAALHTVDGARPDVAVLDRSFLTYPGQAALARARHPELAALIDAPLRAGAPTPLGELTALARARPVFVQLHVNLETAVAPWLIPDGLYAALAPAQVPENERDALEQRDDDTRLAIAAALASDAPADRAGVAGALVWNDYLRTRFYCYLGRWDAANVSARRAWNLAPGDPVLRALTERCFLHLRWDTNNPDP